MLKLTESAMEELRNVKETKRADEIFVRVFVKGFGWGGPMLGITLDELKENDYSQDFEYGKLVVDEELMDMFKGFEIDFQKSWISKGFVVRPNQFAGGSC